MKVIVEKRTIVGTLKSLVGTYNLLDVGHRQFNEMLRFHVVDEEGYDNYIQLHGDFIVVPCVVPFLVDVSRVLTDEEAEELKEILQAQTDEVLQS